MRLWSLSPHQLDRRALVAGWREALLAQKVLAGGTRGYTHHPQLTRFRATDDPMLSIGCYLDGLADAAQARGYRFNRDLVLHPGQHVVMSVTEGQLAYEWEHLLTKAAARDADWHARVLAGAHPRPHPMFTSVPGDVEDWEVIPR